MAGPDLDEAMYWSCPWKSVLVRLVLLGAVADGVTSGAEVPADAGSGVAGAEYRRRAGEEQQAQEGCRKTFPHGTSLAISTFQEQRGRASSSVRVYPAD